MDRPISKTEHGGIDNSQFYTPGATEAYLQRLQLGTGLPIDAAALAQHYPLQNPSPASAVAAIELTPEQRALIFQKCAAGNSFLAERFGLPLTKLGYPTIEGGL